MKDEIESHRATKKRDLVRKRSQNTRRLVQLIGGALVDKHLVLVLDSYCAAECVYKCALVTGSLTYSPLE